MFTDLPAAPVPAYQNVVEFGALWDHVASRPHLRVLEIGSLYGGTLWYWSRLPHIYSLISVDVPSDWPPLAAGVRDARRQWADWFTPRVAFHDHQADSHDPTTVTAVRADLVGEPLDVVFVDGDHTYDGVRADWLTWSPLVRPGGLVAFHDTSTHGTSVEPGVVRWVDELRHHLPSIEWTHPDGVGITAFTMP